MARWLPHENKEVSLRILNDFVEGRKISALEFMGKAIGLPGIEKYMKLGVPEFDSLACREIGYVQRRNADGRKPCSCLRY